MFKKVMSILLTLMLLISSALVSGIGAYATDPSERLTVNATSNYFPQNSVTVAEGEEYVTVTYFINSSKNVLDLQWTLSYDPACLEFDSTANMNESGDDLNLMPLVDNLFWNLSADEGLIKANASKLKTYQFGGKGYVPFVTVTFRVVGSGETTVNLNVECLTLSSDGSSTANDEVIIDNGVINTDTATVPKRITAVYNGFYNPNSYLNVKDLKVTGTGLTYGVDYTYDDKVLTILSSKEITIENTDKDTPTDNTITVQKDVSANIILAGVNIDVADTGVVGKSSGSAAFCIPTNSQGNVTVTLKDGTENTLKSGVSRAGLEKSGTGDTIGTLTIKGNGKLNTYGGNDGAGIGAAYDSSKSCANIIIESGTIFANGSAAGIGGAKNGSGNKITIKAGNITAKSNWGGAGIGGGYKGAGKDITISGGEVIANGGKNGAGIGGGSNGTGSNITISGGKVTATGGEGGAGIGGGSGGTGSNITISDGEVIATSIYTGAGIGGGYQKAGSNITISGGEVTAVSNSYGAGIGGGNNGTGSNITISGGKVTASSDSYGAGIGGGYEGDGSYITVSGGEVKANGGYAGAGIGGCYNGSGSYITVSGGKVTAIGASFGAGIGGGCYGAGSNITISDSEISVTGGERVAGIGGGIFGDGSDIKIENSTVSIIAGYRGTGIGGGSNYDLNNPNNEPGEGKNIIIDGGSVKITFKNPDTQNGPAIGGGFNLYGSSVAVTPKNNKGEDVYLKTVSNKNGDTVYIDGVEYKPSNHSAVDSGDTNLYAYITGKHHVIKVGDAETCYHYDGAFVDCSTVYSYDRNETNHWQICSVEGCDVKHNIESHSFSNKQDNEYHWEECFCGYKRNVVERNYRVTYDLNDGSTPGIRTGVKWSDKVLDNVTAPTRDGWEFIGWKCADETVTADTKYSDLAVNETSVILVAQWKDITIPVITGLENGKTYCSAQTFTVIEENIASVTVNGNPVDLDENNRYTLSPAEGEQVIVVTDKDGNASEEMIVTVNDGHRGGKATCISKAKCDYCGAEYGELDSHNHRLTLVPAKEATSTETGNTEYYVCEDCQRWFEDANGETEITDKDSVIIPIVEEPEQTEDLFSYFIQWLRALVKLCVRLFKDLVAIIIMLFAALIS